MEDRIMPSFPGSTIKAFRWKQPTQSIRTEVVDTFYAPKEIQLKLDSVITDADKIPTYVEPSIRGLLRNEQKMVP